jgi:hypothetical protein
VSKDNDRLGGEIFRFTVEPRGRRYDSASPRGSYERGGNKRFP